MTEHEPGCVYSVETGQISEAKIGRGPSAYTIPCPVVRTFADEPSARAFAREIGADSITVCKVLDKKNHRIIRTITLPSCGPGGTNK